MTTTSDDIKLLKKINSLNESSFKKNKKQWKTFTPLRGVQKNIPFKNLNFNPMSFFINKYSPKTLMLMNRKNINYEDNLGRNEKNRTIIENKDNREYIYSMNTKKIKLKPLNKNRSCSQFLPNNEDIIIPSNETTKEIINYNKSSAHNTLLNYYHKNNRNLKVINFIKTNSFQNNNFPNSFTKNSLNKSLNNNSYYISKNEMSTNINQKSETLNQPTNENNPLMNLSPQPKKPKTISKINAKKLQNKNFIDYKLEKLSKKMPHKLSFYADYFFKEENEKEKSTSNKNKEESEKDFINSRKNSNFNYQFIEFKGKRRLIVTNLTNCKRKKTFSLKGINDDFHHIMKNPFENESNNIGNVKKYNPLEQNNLAKKIQQLLLNPNTSKVRNNHSSTNNKYNNENKILSYKEMKALSKQGFEKMEADKYRRFNLLVKNTNKEVIQLEKRLDELFEENKKVFLGAKSEFDI